MLRRTSLINAKAKIPNTALDSATPPDNIRDSTWSKNDHSRAQMAELVDALVSGTSGATRGGSSPLLGTKQTFKQVQ